MSHTTPTPAASLAHDPAWPRTGGWPAPAPSERADLALIGIPTSRTSLSRSNAHETPDAVRQALRRYSGHLVAAGLPSARGTEAELVIDEALRIVDAGNVTDPDSEAGEITATAKVAELARLSELVVALGGDNALTVPAALGVAGKSLSTAGIITLDAHHDLRDGRSNGSPVRRLVDAGLDPRRIVQIGIADFANSRAYRQRARDWGITVIHRDELHERPLREITAEALEIAGAAGGPIHVDLDVDVCDRSVAPGCPASIPGGIQAHELRAITRLLATDPRVRGIDIAEVDATADAPDGRTVRLAALCVLEAAAGLAQRLGRATPSSPPQQDRPGSIHR
ncbi:agmatinase family protein [Leucobacter insecticola]|uniref:Agmatinase family protein n=1 Tax=Leucobacter insecticola TaxID=2714934 RepID=A0A6G8FJC0_9MICO|nr:agmatinase family protein [Leucobacter insecticola]QIM16162.1 agmatinase family protein [Leucobacter insecticola]